MPEIFFGQLAPGISFADTRETNILPLHYRREIRAEFKARNAVGAPGEGFYYGMLTLAPWIDNSGDKNHQLNFNNGGIFYRTGFHKGPWEAWRSLVLTNTKGQVGIQTTTPAAPLDIQGKIRFDYKAPVYGVAISANHSNTGGWARGYYFFDENTSASLEGLDQKTYWKGFL
ncbi:hypothetical protein GNY06_07165 [Elizabethkingia argentiflava]|uniref:Uncharacterized protein n=1 Tax=Elizabethkingia argenteiflava TaxID=2681556 RepID=A0A845PTM6_9FLAO|nr:hypothetical protein [Elizabethkingia argenteiflava]NAW51164.1 hypothetical protein [Elizabethkingia argenteiflava]